ncbi:MAG: peroxiredoxin [Parachlamydiales bacterium]|nr:peroxiredoxin [Parachlamydiales bacterium]
MEQSISIIGKRSPEFVVDAIINGRIERINSLDFYGKYLLLFFYQSDFSLICPTEMLALQDELNEFKKRNVDVVSVSVDSLQSHMAWLNVPRSQGGIEGITYPMISDIHKDLSRAFCVLDETNGCSLRGAFIVDNRGIVQYAAVHNFSIGRNIKELLRVVDAVQFTQKHGELCPVDWKPGEKPIHL